MHAAEPAVSHRKRVAILGAGPAGLATALALAKTDRFDVHVYQMGWRAGGKCATGRDLPDLRSRQNGSHYLFGCYHNTFALLREAYEVLERSNHPDAARFGRFQEELESRNLLVGTQRYPRAEAAFDSEPWFRYMPQNMAAPGAGAKLPTPFDWAIIALQFALGFLLDAAATVLSALAGLAGRRRPAVPERFYGLRLCLWLFPLDPLDRSWRARLLRAPWWPARWAFNALFALVWHAARALSQLATLLVPERLGVHWSRKLLRLLDTLLTLGRGLFRRVLRASLRRPKTSSSAIRRGLILGDLATTLLVGYFRDGLNRAGGFERIDGEDFREWLARHGAQPETRGSPLITTWYDAVISYRDGDERAPECSAGAAVQSMLRALLTYKGAFAYQMRAEVGDSFVAPVVKALETLGVNFHFFTRVKRVVACTERRRVTRVELDVQCTEHGPGAEFLEVADRRFPDRPKRKAWPSQPLGCATCAAVVPPLDSYYSTHAVGRELLRAREPDTEGESFDVVVAALPLGVMADVLVRELPDHSFVSVASELPAWQQCFRGVRHTESQALRIWFKVPLAPAGSRSLGWTQAPPILSGFRWPFSTWEDNSQATHVHDFPDGERPLTIATVFGPLATGPLDIRHVSHFEEQTRLARSAALRFVEHDMLELWPGLRADAGEGQVDWDALIDLSGGKGNERFRWQHVTANVGPIESYVQAAPGTLRHRLRPDESQLENLFLAGDWTRNGIEVGSVEGAIISGLKAARAIAGEPLRIIGGDDFDLGTVFVNEA